MEFVEGHRWEELSTRHCLAGHPAVDEVIIAPLWMLNAEFTGRPKYFIYISLALL